MVLDLECVRDVMLKIEEKSELDSDFKYHPIHAEQLCCSFEKYEPRVVLYTLIMLEEAEYIKVEKCSDFGFNCDYDPQKIEVFDLTFLGTQYLNSVRNQNVWNKIKPFVKDMTLDLIKAKAIEMLSDMLPF